MRATRKEKARFQAMADDLVMRVLVRGFVDYEGPLASEPQKLAARRLREIAEAEDPDAVLALLDERRRCRDGLIGLLQTPKRGSK